MRACVTCVSLGHSDLRCKDELAADVALLNESKVHISPYRQEGFSRETVHALAAIVRLVIKQHSREDSDDNSCGRCGHTPRRCTCLKPADNE